MNTSRCDLGMAEEKMKRGEEGGDPVRPESSEVRGSDIRGQLDGPVQNAWVCICGWDCERLSNGGQVRD